MAFRPAKIDLYCTFCCSDSSGLKPARNLPRWVSSKTVMIGGSLPLAIIFCRAAPRFSTAAFWAAFDASCIETPGIDFEKMLALPVPLMKASSASIFDVLGRLKGGKVSLDESSPSRFFLFIRMILYFVYFFRF